MGKLTFGNELGPVDERIAMPDQRIHDWTVNDDLESGNFPHIRPRTEKFANHATFHLRSPSGNQLRYRHWCCHGLAYRVISQCCQTDDEIDGIDENCSAGFRRKTEFDGALRNLKHLLAKDFAGDRRRLWKIEKRVYRVNFNSTVIIEHIR